MVLWPYTTMDDEGLPLSSPIPLSRPAAQALNDNPDAPLSPESTGGDGSQASDTQNLKPAALGLCLQATPSLRPK